MVLSKWQRKKKPTITGWYQCKGDGFLEGPIVWRYYDVEQNCFLWNTKNKYPVGDPMAAPPKKRSMSAAGFLSNDQWRGIING